MRTTTERILSVLGCKEFSVSIAFVGTHKIRQLNCQHRNRNVVTDVLSFPQLTIEERKLLPNFDVEKKRLGLALLGDIVICPAIAHNNSRKCHRTLEDEITALIIHSLLHLLGYDHQSDADAKRMQRREQEVLAAIKS